MAQQQAKSGFPKKWIGIGIAVIVILILVGTVWGSYNTLVRLSQGTDEAWANVETQYQRRIDLIPNLVNIAQTYMINEINMLEKVTALRSQWMQQQGNSEAQAQTTNQIEGALKTIFATAESYPILTSSPQFTTLMDSNSETENMVAVARTRYNNAVRDYNTATKVFPSNIIAGWFGFGQRTYFEATTPGAQNAPKINMTTIP
jgi:LemA protein